MDGESEKLPETMDVDEAVALMERGPPQGGDYSGPSPLHEDERTGRSAPQEEEEGLPSEAAEAAQEGAPEFWSAEDKAAWDDVPAEVRPLLKKYEQQRVEFVNEKAREAAAVREQARAEVARHAGLVEQAARWWAEAGPALQQAFANKWAQVDWRALAEKNPSEWARLNQQRLEEAQTLAEAERRGHADRQAAEHRAAQELSEARGAEHKKLAEKLPDFFGTPDAAAKTYDELGRFLLGKGIPVDRVNAVYEAPIIELALNAFRFEQAQQHALQSAARAKQGQSARPTPTRIAPGPGSRPGNRGSDAVRQASERFRQSGGSSLDDAAELIRLNDL
jgi:hypothetical protein